MRTLITLVYAEANDTDLIELPVIVLPEGEKA